MDAKAVKKIVFIITGLAYGGAETQLVRLATGLKKRGWAVGVISMIAPQAFIDELAAAGITVVSLGMRRGIPDPRAVFRLAALLRKWKPNIVHSHMVHANLISRLTRPLTKVPVLISTAHSIDEGGRHREIAYRLTDRLTDITTIISQVAAERYESVGAVPAGRLRFIPNGIDTETFMPNLETRKEKRNELGLKEEFVWLAVGRFDVPKDYPNMLKAFALARGASVLLVAGQGPLKEEAETIARELNISEKVRFLGVRKDIPELMNAADAYLMSSAWEGMPMVLLEAAATGLPILTTDVGGNREVVLDGINGFLVPARDSEALAGAIMRLEKVDEKERIRMGTAGREHVVKNYSLHYVLDLWENLYEEFLRKKGLI